MSEVLATNLAEARQLAATLRTAGTNAADQATLGRCDASLGPASLAASSATAAAGHLVGRLADRCRSLALGVDAAADHTERSDV